MMSHSMQLENESTTECMEEMHRQEQVNTSAKDILLREFQEISTEVIDREHKMMSQKQSQTIVMRKTCSYNFIPFPKFDT